MRCLCHDSDRPPASTVPMPSYRSIQGEAVAHDQLPPRRSGTTSYRSKRRHCSATGKDAFPVARLNRLRFSGKKRPVFPAAPCFSPHLHNAADCGSTFWSSTIIRLPPVIPKWRPLDRHPRRSNRAISKMNAKHARSTSMPCRASCPVPRRNATMHAGCCRCSRTMPITLSTRKTACFSLATSAS